MTDASLIGLYRTRLIVQLLLLLETAGRSPEEQVKLVLLWGFAECGFRKATEYKPCMLKRIDEIYR